MKIGFIDTILERKWIEYSIIGSMVLVVGMILFTPNSAFINKLVAHAFEAVILFLASAMGFMILDKPRIMFTCLAMAMVLSLYLKQKSRSGLQSIFPIQSSEFSISQLLINEGADQYEKISLLLKDLKTDIIHVQELTPDWHQVVDNALLSNFPYQAKLLRIDPYGMAVYSKYPIKKVDTLEYSDTVSIQKIPALKIQIDIGGKNVEFVACHLLPRLNNTDFTKVQGFMDLLTNWSKQNNNEFKVISGDLGVTPWDYILQRFISETGLELSRREPHLFVQPFEHILFSKSIDCSKLKEVVTRDRIHLGIEGRFHFR